MSNSSNLERVRSMALERIERAERRYRWGIVLVAAFEAVLGVAYLFLMDFRDRQHWLILIAACLTYSVVLIGIVNLGAYVNSATQTLLRAILASRDRAQEQGGDQG